MITTQNPLRRIAVVIALLAALAACGNADHCNEQQQQALNVFHSQLASRAKMWTLRDKHTLMWELVHTGSKVPGTSHLE